MSQGNVHVPKSRFWKLLIIEIIAVICVAVYVLIDAHDIYRWWVGDTHFVKAPSTCNLHQSSCTVLLKENIVAQFDITPKPIPLMKPLKFRVILQNIHLPYIELTLFATNMNMGFHTFKLYAKGNGLFVGEGMLPTCVVGNMIWQANLVIETSQQSLGAIFLFQTDK